MKNKLVIGMPAGSLADVNRGGNLVTLLKAAGFPTQGYEKGGPTTFPLHSMLFGWDGRPQEFGAQLALHEVDIAIGGDDWIAERLLEYKHEYGKNITLSKALSLGRGKVRLVIINAPRPEGQSFDAWLTQLLTEQKIIRAVSEMPYLFIQWFQKKRAALGFGEEWDCYSIQKYNTPPKIEKGLVVYESWGKTEAKVLHGSVDFGLEITQTGSAIQNYGLRIMDEIMVSETGIWANPHIKENPAKYNLARMFLLNLYGSIFAENKVLVFFNARKENVPRLLDYLRDNRLFGDEPTMNEGANFTEFSVQMDTQGTTLPLARARFELAMLGATHIETIPLESCIPGLDAVDF